jgi:hypothetical protein
MTTLNTSAPVVNAFPQQCTTRIQGLDPNARARLRQDLAELRAAFAEATAIQATAEALPVADMVQRWGRAARDLRGAVQRVGWILPLPFEFENLLAQGPNLVVALGLTGARGVPETQAALQSLQSELAERRHVVCEQLEHIEAALAPSNGPPDGTSADDYMAATDCLPDINPQTYKRLNRILGDNPTIRCWRPTPRRLMVHIGDWRRFVRGRKRQEEVALAHAEETIAELSSVHQGHTQGRRATP